MIIKTHKFKLILSAEQEQRLSQWIGTCRFVYNMAMDIKKQWWEKHKTNITKGELQKQITEVRQDIEWIGDVNAQTLQDVTDRLFLAYDKFFDGAGFPRFAKRGQYRSVGFKQGVKLHGNRISLPKIGKVKFRNSLKENEQIGNIKTAKVIQEADGWYICLCTETEPKMMLPPKNKGIKGMDLGLTHLAIFTDEKVDNPRFYVKNQKRLARAQRSVNRKVKDSKNRDSAKQKVALIHKEIADSRKDFLHKLSTKLIRENQTISMENLNIAGMVKNPNLSKHILDAGWGMLQTMLTYKAEWYERDLFIAGRWFPSSKLCSECKVKNRGLKLSEREWVCQNCGTVHDRDKNSAKNLEDEALRVRQQNKNSLLESPTENKITVGQTGRACGVSLEIKKDNIEPLAAHHSDCAVKVLYAQESHVL